MANHRKGDPNCTEACDPNVCECPECGSNSHEGFQCESCSSYESAQDERDDDFDCDFADPGGRSALRAETEDNPRDLPCPDCGAPNRLTPKDRALGYRCDSCADRSERGFDY